MAFATEHLDHVTVEDVAGAVHVSSRTLRRMFETHTRMSWRRYLLQTRLLRAIAMLSEPGPSVIEVSTAVGFRSVSAFTRAFTRHTGETPSASRRHVCSRGESPRNGM